MYEAVLERGFAIPEGLRGKGLQVPEGLRNTALARLVNDRFRYQERLSSDSHAKHLEEMDVLGKPQYRRAAEQTRSTCSS